MEDKSQEQHDPPVLLPCPHCNRLTRHLKCYDVNVLLFLFVYAAWSQQSQTACPRCMRKILLRNSLTNLVTANVLSPWMLLLNVVSFYMTCTRGHSRTITEELKPPTDEEAAKLMTDATMLGAAYGAIVGGFGSAVLGLLGGWLVFLPTRKSLGEPIAAVLGEAVALTIGYLMAMAANNGTRHFRGPFGWVLLGSAVWISFSVADRYWLDWKIAGTGYSWAAAGGLVGLLGGSRACAFRLGTGGGEEDLEWCLDDKGAVLTPLLFGQ